MPRADIWPGEFVSEHAERLKWLSGFSGSSGIGIILADKAVVLTDGRYTIQVARQVPKDLWTTGDFTELHPADWLLAHLKEGAKVGFDPWLHTKSFVEKARKKLDLKKIELVPIDRNPLDDIWVQDRPSLPLDPVVLFDAEIAGRTAHEKRALIAGKLKEQKIESAVLAMPDSVAWLLNIRGHDMDMTPVALSYALIKADESVEWFIPPEKVPPEVRKALGNQVSIFPVEDLSKRLAMLKGPVLVDDQRTPLWFETKLNELDIGIKKADDPCLLPKACKTAPEQESIKTAHIIDAVALIKFHKWVKETLPSRDFSEIDVQEKLQSIRKESTAYKSDSFDTISGFKGNGAVIHYRATPETTCTVDGNGLLLVDSGAQYAGGTTDVTRTFSIGNPTDEEKRAYTLVLKGHIAVARAIFPHGATGAQIDTFARQALWEHGLDFAHGTGHGVGCYLNVHEDAAHLSPRGDRKIEPGMLLSNEPGVYIEDHYGIRIENLLLVQKTGEKDILRRDRLCFETVTLAPYDSDLICPDLLDHQEKTWLSDYYAKISHHILPQLDKEHAEWLKKVLTL